MTDVDSFKDAYDEDTVDLRFSLSDEQWVDICGEPCAEILKDRFSDDSRLCLFLERCRSVEGYRAGVFRELKQHVAVDEIVSVFEGFLIDAEREVASGQYDSREREVLVGSFLKDFSKKLQGLMDRMRIEFERAASSLEVERKTLCVLSGLDPEKIPVEAVSWGDIERVVCKPDELSDEDWDGFKVDIKAIDMDLRGFLDGVNAPLTVSEVMSLAEDVAHGHFLVINALDSPCSTSASGTFDLVPCRDGSVAIWVSGDSRVFMGISPQE
jgi:hypothetical protein